VAEFAENASFKPCIGAKAYPGFKKNKLDWLTQNLRKKRL
jgi:hypothetical protein